MCRLQGSVKTFKKQCCIKCIDILELLYVFD